MSKKYNLYLGKAGQFAVMSHFLMRGWNVAVPEVDVGDDLLVVEDKKGIFFRVQVKTAQAVERNKGYSVQFNLSLAQIQSFTDPEIYFVFVICRNNQWTNLLVVPREDLSDLFTEHNIGSIVNGQLILYFTFNDNEITCSKVDFNRFHNNFDDFPLILH
jgi:PD-(D/E)XK endonuclease